MTQFDNAKYQNKITQIVKPKFDNAKYINKFDNTTYQTKNFRTQIIKSNLII